MTDEREHDDDALMERLGALPAHDVRPEVRDAIAAEADAILAREARPAQGDAPAVGPARAPYHQGRVARLYRAIELPLLALAACAFLAWNVSSVASIHRGASVELAPRVAAGARPGAAYTASREHTMLASVRDPRGRAPRVRRLLRRGT